MRDISSLIAATTPHDGEHKLMGAWAAGAFVVVLLAGSAGAAFWIGSAMSSPTNQPASFELADENFQ